MKEGKDQELRNFLPLYRQASRINHDTVVKNGLLFNKWNRNWSYKPGTDQIEFDKQNYIDGWHNQKVGDPNLLAEYQNRMTNLVKRRRGIIRQVKSVERWVIGTGLPHPLEIGMAWHHMLGVPYIPGSTFKGAIRAWTEKWLSKESDKITEVFGSEIQQDETSSTIESHVGNVIFFDALPTSPVKIQADIITPHFQEYYQDAAKHPHDRHEPVPIPFLTVAAEQSYAFHLAPRKTDDYSLRCIEKAVQWMIEALSFAGIGAKTALGYGRFE